jgi:hypothetical protein
MRPAFPRQKLRQTLFFKNRQFHADYGRADQRFGKKSSKMAWMTVEPRFEACQAIPRLQPFGNNVCKA